MEEIVRKGMVLLLWRDILKEMIRGINYTGVVDCVCFEEEEEERATRLR